MSYIGAEPIVSATRTITEVTATAGQTVFTANGGYTVGYIDVFLNGAQLQTVDFTASNGSSITLTEAAQVGDVIRLVAWGTFSSANITSGSLSSGGPTWSPTGGVTLPRIDSSNEGGQLNFNRASDNTATWAIDSFGNTSTPTLRFVDGANVRAVIDGSGNVGIGTSSPQNQLHINGTTTGYARFQSSNRTFTIGSLASAFGFVINDVDAGQERMRIDAGGLFMFDSGYGSAATAYGCRAWVNFNGTGTVAIRSSGNVSSITDLGTGSYRLNFSNAMPDANYNVVGASTSAVGVSATFLVTTFRRDTDTRVSNTTSGTTFSTCTDTSTAVDVADVNVSVFR